MRSAKKDLHFQTKRDLCETGPRSICYLELLLRRAFEPAFEKWTVKAEYEMLNLADWKM